MLYICLKSYLFLDLSIILITLNFKYIIHRTIDEMTYISLDPHFQSSASNNCLTFLLIPIMIPLDSSDLPFFTHNSFLTSLQV